MTYMADNLQLSTITHFIDDIDQSNTILKTETASQCLYRIHHTTNEHVRIEFKPLNKTLTYIIDLCGCTV